MRGVRHAWPIYSDFKERGKGLPDTSLAWRGLGFGWWIGLGVCFHGGRGRVRCVIKSRPRLGPEPPPWTQKDPKLLKLNEAAGMCSRRLAQGSAFRPSTLPSFNGVRPRFWGAIVIAFR